MPLTDIFLIAFIIILYSWQTLFCKFFSDRYTTRPELSSSVFCICEGYAVALITLCFIGFRFAPSPVTILLGVLAGAAAYGYNKSLIAAGNRGSYAFLNVMMLFGGIIMPLIYSITRGEVPAWYQFVAIGAMLVSFVLMNAKEIRLKGSTLAYYLFTLLLFFCNGMYDVLLKMQTVECDAERQQMIVIAFFTNATIALIELMCKEKKQTLAAFKMSKTAAAWLIACLIVAASAVNVLVMLLSRFNEAMLYTIQCGGVLVLSAVYSLLFFKEKLYPTKTAGLILAVLSILVLSATPELVNSLFGI